MDGSDNANLLWYLTVLVLVGASLLSRRIPWRSALGMIVGWIGIFAIVLILFSYRTEISAVARRVSSELTGTPNQSAEGSRLQIAVAADGHYWVDGTINGTSARFLIDSGATVTALSSATAKATQVEIDTQRLPVTMQTANGPVEAQRAMAAALAVGPIVMRDVPVVVAESFGTINVLGMNFLSRLKGWRVDDGVMVLEP